MVEDKLLKLNQLRRQIDSINCAIFNNLIVRDQTSRQIARIKKELKLSIFDMEREQQMVEKIKITVGNKLGSEYIERLFNEILKYSKNSMEEELAEKPAEVML